MRPSLIKNESPGVWLLDASIKIKDGATFYINSTDTEWLKVNSTAGSAHNIIPQGNIRIDSIRLTSWDASSDNFAEISPDGKSPRSFIRIEKGNGTTEISNS
jgi:mannuronan 5-epimerase